MPRICDERRSYHDDEGSSRRIGKKAAITFPSLFSKCYVNATNNAKLNLKLRFYITHVYESRKVFCSGRLNQVCFRCTFTVAIALATRMHQLASNC